MITAQELDMFKTFKNHWLTCHVLYWHNKDIEALFANVMLIVHRTDRLHDPF